MRLQQLWDGCRPDRAERVPALLQIAELPELASLGPAYDAYPTLIGTGCNPNVAAVVVIGIEGGWTQKVEIGRAHV